MCSVGDAFRGFCRPGQRDIDCRGFIQLCRDCGLSSDGFGDADAEKVFLKVMAVAKRRVDLPRFVEAMRAVAEQRGMEEDAVHKMLISHCSLRPMGGLSRTASEPTIRRSDPFGSEEPEAEFVEPSKRRHRRHLPSNKRRPKKLEVKDLQDPPSCQSTPGGDSLGTLDALGHCSPRSMEGSASARNALFQMPSINPTQVMMRRNSKTNEMEPEPLPSPCGGGVPPELKVIPPSPASVQSTAEPEPLPSPFRGPLPLDLKEPEPLPSPSHAGLTIDIKAAEEFEASERLEMLTPNTGRSIRLPSGTPGSTASRMSPSQRPSSPPTGSSAAVARSRLSPDAESAASRHGIPTLAIGDCTKVRTPGEADRVDGVEDAFAAFCGEHQGLDVNGFVSFCKHCSLLDRNFTAQDARLVYAEAVPVSLQRMELRSFEVALARVAAQRGLDRGHIRRLVVSPDVLASCPSKLQVMAPADRAAGEQMLPLMPVAPAPCADGQEHGRRPGVVRGRRDSGTQGFTALATVSRGTRLRSLRRSETMPPSLGKQNALLAEADAAALAPLVAPPTPPAGEHVEMEAPAALAAELPPPLEPEPPSPPGPPAGEGAGGPEAAAGGEAREPARAGLGAEAPSAELPGEAEPEEAPVGSWPTLPLASVASDQACHMVSLVCAR